jgi:hypothetical protein
VYEPVLINSRTLHVESLKAMGRFYSWKYIFRHLSHLDFFHATIGLYGKKAVKRALCEAREYFDTINSLRDSRFHDVGHLVQ